MRQHANAEEDIAARLTPRVQPNSPWRITHVDPLTGFRLRVRFCDGTEGVAEMSRLIHSDEAGVFAVLRDETLFRQATIALGAVTWPGDLDVAPDAMHAAIQETGVWIA